MIRFALKSWGSHDAILIKDRYGNWFVGDSHYPRSRITPISRYISEVESGKIQVRVMLPIEWTYDKGVQAGIWWVEHVDTIKYDWMAFPYLLWKCVAKKWDVFNAGAEWRWYCTEGVKAALLSVGWDVYKKKNPTPLTTEKRVGVSLREITSLVLVCKQ